MRSNYTISFANINIYLKHLNKELGKIFKGDYTVSKGFKLDNIKEVKGYPFYEITVVARELAMLDDYKSVADGPMKEIMEFKGITNIAFGKNGTGLIILIYPLGFFDQDEYFDSLKAVNKYEL